MNKDTQKFKFLYRDGVLRQDISYLLSKSPTSKFPRGNYYEKSIKKQNGKSRKISIPTKKLKSIQKKIHKEITQEDKDKRIVHPQVFCFGKGKSPKENALSHINNRYFFQADIKDFFGNVSRYQVWECFSKTLGCGKNEADILTFLTTYKHKLPQGASTSPILALLCSKGIDNRIANFCKQRKMVYTRYMDDITISSKKPITEEMQKTIRDIVFQEKFTLNESKTKIFDIENEKQCKITGIIIKDKRLLTEYHHDQEKHVYITKNTPITTGLSKKLDGVLSFIKQIDPDYYDSLIKHKCCLYCN